MIDSVCICILQKKQMKKSGKILNVINMII